MKSAARANDDGHTALNRPEVVGNARRRKRRKRMNEKNPAR